MKHDPKSMEEFLAELRAHDPEAYEQVERARTARGGGLEGEGLESMEAAFGGRAGDVLETIVLREGRPVLDVLGGEAELDIAEPESQIWKQRLAGAKTALAPSIRAVGRIEVANHPRADWFGTGWLLRDDVVVTNRHVAEVFARFDDAGFEFRPGLDGVPMTARIDFIEEFGSDASREFPLFRILHIEEDAGPDVAFFRVEPVGGAPLPAPIGLAGKAAGEGAQVAVIGYPARDPFFPDQKLMNEIFRGRFDKKRLAPGLVTGVSPTRLLHDCSTLGGNSGAAVVSLADGRAVALHFAGTLFKKNHAVPGEVVGNRLDDVLAGRVRRRREAPAPRPQPTRAQSTPRAATPSRRILTATIPIRVQVEIGEAAADLAARPRVIPATTSDVGADDDLIEVTEARPEDFLDREGYQPDFLGSGIPVPLPTVTREAGDTLTFEFDGKTHEVLDYQHFSVLMSRSRRMCRYSACNIDGASSKKRKRKGWRRDPRIPSTAQILKECYGNPPRFSRGHMTRREDPVWGSDDDASTGNVDSMNVTNAVPQIQPFNAGIWLRLEDYALDNTREDDMRICVFTGPFLEEQDPIRFGVQVPVSFWKVIAFIHDQTGELSATGYVMSQESFIGEEEFVFSQHESSQRSIAEIEQRAGLSFGPLAAADPFDQLEEAAPTLLTHPSQIRFTR